MAKCYVRNLNDLSPKGIKIATIIKFRVGFELVKCGFNWGADDRFDEGVIEFFLMFNMEMSLKKVRFRIYLFRSLKRRKGLGLLIGAKLGPRLRREVSAEDKICVEGLNIFTVLGVSGHFDCFLVRPPLQPLLSFLFWDTEAGGGLGTKKLGELMRGDAQLMEVTDLEPLDGEIS